MKEKLLYITKHLTEEELEKVLNKAVKKVIVSKKQKDDANK